MGSVKIIYGIFYTDYRGIVIMLLNLLQKDLEMIIAAIIGTLGFCMFFNVKRDKLIYGCIGGAFSVVAYFTLLYYFFDKANCNSVRYAILYLYCHNPLNFEIISKFIKSAKTKCSL